MQKIPALMISLMLLSSACVSVAELPEGVKIQASLPEGTRSVLVRPTTMQTGTIKNVDGLTDAPQFFARSLKSNLENKQPGWQIRLADVQGAMPDADIKIETEIVGVDGGSAGLRFWIGFSAGATESTVKVTILDKTGRELATTKISERTMCPIGACVESNEATVRRNLQNLAAEAADFIVNPAEYEKMKGSGS